MIVFRGNTTRPFNSNFEVYSPHFWHDFDQGDSRTNDIAVARYRPDAVYVVMLVERDDGRDIKGPEVIGAFRTQTRLVWQAQMFSLLGAANGPAGEADRATAASAIIDALNALASVYMDLPKLSWAMMTF